MSLSGIDRPDLPEFMTWEQLGQLPDEIAGQIELWEGRVVWLRRGPGEHQIFMRRLTNALERSAGDDMAGHPDRCWVANLETTVFLGSTGKSDFVTPDFLIHRCLGGPLHPVDYRLDDEWINDADGTVSFPQPFPIEVPWSALAF